MHRAFRKYLIGMGSLIASVSFAANEPSLSLTEPQPSVSAAEDLQARYDLATQLLKDKQYGSAAEAFARVANARTDDPVLFKNWGIALSALGRLTVGPMDQMKLFQAAADRFSRAAELKANDKSVLVLWAETLVAIGDLPTDRQVRHDCYWGAADKFRLASGLTPDDPEIYNRWAEVLMAKLPEFAEDDLRRFELFQKAGDVISKAVDHARSTRETAQSYSNWGNALLLASRVAPEQGQAIVVLREASDKFERSARLVPNSAATYAQWGAALVEAYRVSKMRSELRSATEKLNSSTSLKADDPSTWYNLACAYSLIGNNEALAVQSLKKCFETDPRSTYRKMAQKDPDLIPLHGNRAFEDLFTLIFSPTAPIVNPPVRN